MTLESTFPNAGSAVSTAAFWLASQTDVPHPIVPELRSRFGLSARDACEAIRATTELRAQRRADEAVAERKDAAVAAYLHDLTGEPVEVGRDFVDWRPAGASTDYVIRTCFITQAEADAIMAEWNDEEIPVDLGDDTCRASIVGGFLS